MMFTSSEIRFIFHGDPGHAWLEVPLSLVKEYGLEKDISSYSYVNEKSGMVFLEEDSDMPKFLKAFQRETALSLTCLTTTRSQTARYASFLDTQEVKYEL